MNGINPVSVTKTIVTDFPVTAITTSKEFKLRNITGYSKVSIGITWKDFDDVDATVSLTQQNDPNGNFVDIADTSQTMSTASENPTSGILEVSTFGGYSIGVKFTKGSVTTGTFTIVAILKI